MIRHAGVFALVLIVSPAVAQETVSDLARLCRNVDAPRTPEQILDAAKCLGFFDGFSRGLAHAQAVTNRANRGVAGYVAPPAVCPPPGTTGESVAKLFVRMADHNPQANDWPIEDGLSAVWTHYFPCH